GGRRRARARGRLRLTEERDRAPGLPRLRADPAAPLLRAVLLRLHLDAREVPARGARAVGLDLDLPDPTRAEARGVDRPHLQVLRRAAGPGLVDAQVQLEGALVADRRRADGPSVRDGAAGLLLVLGRRHPGRVLVAARHAVAVHQAAVDVRRGGGRDQALRMPARLPRGRPGRGRWIHAGRYVGSSRRVPRKTVSAWRAWPRRRSRLWSNLTVLDPVPIARAPRAHNSPADR